MKELWLKYTDEKGELKRIPVKQEKYAVGRHSENDLSVANSAISRKHVKIERFADIFMISDVGSSLGTQINGVELTEPVALYNKDKISLGGGFEIEVEIISDEDESAAARGADSAKSENEEAETASAVSSAPSASGGSSIPASFFFLAPIFGILVLLSVGGIFLATSGGSQKSEPKANEFVYSNERETARENTPETKKTVDEETPAELPASESLSESSPEKTSEITISSTTRETNSAASAPPKVSGELEAVEVNSASFLRRVAQSDPRAFLTERQQEIVQKKIVQFKNSPALAENLKSAKKNAAEIASLANSKNLKPQFLTVAALAALGNTRGDVLQTAQAMAQILDDLSRNIGDERSDDALLVIAAYDQGAAGNSLALRNKLQSLVNESPSSSRQIRSIWYLREKNHITEAEFDSALKFLAIGTISQNPKEFGVNSEAVIF